MDALRGSTDPALAELRSAFRALEPLFVDIWQAQDDPDYGGPRWYELYRGSPLGPTFVCVDFNNNVLHARLVGREILTLTFIPGWFYDVISACFTIRDDISTAYVEDLSTAVPRRFEVSVDPELALAEQMIEVPVGGKQREVSFARPAFGYEYEPARAFAVEPAAAEARGLAAWMPSVEAPRADRVSWSAFKLRLCAGPGVAFEERPLVADEALAEARATYVPHTDSLASCAQTLQFELERRQNPSALPGLGAPFRSVPLAEADLVAGREMSREGRALALEQARPDGVDIIVMRPESGSDNAPWLQQVASELIVSAASWFQELLGGLPPRAPLTVRIRVDPASADDRFAYRVQYLDSSTNAHPEPVADTDPLRPVVRVSVRRTKAVQVFIDTSMTDWGEEDLESVIEYHEAVVGFHDVPFSINDENDVYNESTLLDREATLWDILTVSYALGEFIPVGPVETFYDMRDLGSVGTYLVYGTDVAGEEITAVDAALTVGGLVLPEVGERVVKGLVKGARRLRTIGDDPFSRLVATGDALDPQDATLADELAGRLTE